MTGFSRSLEGTPSLLHNGSVPYHDDEGVRDMTLTYALKVEHAVETEGVLRTQPPSRLGDASGRENVEV